jgi:hypothetical protein
MPVRATEELIEKLKTPQFFSVPERYRETLQSNNPDYIREAITDAFYIQKTILQDPATGIAYIVYLMGSTGIPLNVNESSLNKFPTAPNVTPKITTIFGGAQEVKIDRLEVAPMIRTETAVGGGRAYLPPALKTTDILELINTSFGTFESLDRIPVLDIGRELFSSAFAPEVVSSEDSFNGDARTLYEAADYIRSYIDLWHDVEDSDIATIKLLATTAVIAPEWRQWFDSYMAPGGKIDQQIFTRSGKIIQPKCRALLEELTRDFLEKCHARGWVTWIPATKKDALIDTFSIDNPVDMDRLVLTLRRDGITHFFVESAASSIGKRLTDYNIPYDMLQADLWDAGTGFGTHERAEQIIGLGPAPKYVPLPAPYNLSVAPPITMFGFLVTVSDDNRVIRCTMKADPTKYVEIGGGPIKLSLNGVLAALGLPAIRGEAIVAALPVVATNCTPIEKRLMTYALKTWCDLIQLRIWSIAKPLLTPIGIRLRVMKIISDGCCETSSAMIGSDFVLRNDGRVLTYYCYDKNARQLDAAEIYLRKQVLLKILRNKDALRALTERWFERRINALTTIRTHTPDPALFNTSALFIEKYTSQRITALAEFDRIDELARIITANPATDVIENIKQLPSTVDAWFKGITNAAGLLGEFVLQHDLFIKALDTIGNLQPRADIDSFLTAVSSLKREVTNSFGTRDTTDEQIRGLVATSIAATFAAKDGNTDRWFTTISSIKTRVLTTVLGVPEGTITGNPAGYPISTTPIPSAGEFVRMRSVIPATTDADTSDMKELKKALITLTDIEQTLLLLLTGAPRVVDGVSQTYTNVIRTNRAEGRVNIPFAQNRGTTFNELLGRVITALGGGLLGGADGADDQMAAGGGARGGARSRRNKRTRRRRDRAAARRKRTIRRRK